MIPSYEEIMLPLLNLLSDKQEHTLHFKKKSRKNLIILIPYHAKDCRKKISNLSLAMRS